MCSAGVSYPALWYVHGIANDPRIYYVQHVGILHACLSVTRRASKKPFSFAHSGESFPWQHAC
jgi:hypothetical protein